MRKKNCQFLKLCRHYNVLFYSSSSVSHLYIYVQIMRKKRKKRQKKKKTNEKECQFNFEKSLSFLKLTLIIVPYCYFFVFRRFFTFVQIRRTNVVGSILKFIIQKIVLNYFFRGTNIS